MGEAEEQAAVRILVVDHRPFQRRLVAEALRALGRVDVSYADGAAQCLAALADLEIDVIILDWDIDGRTGLQLVRRLRGGEAGDRARRLPLVMVSTHNTAPEVERARNAGVDELVLRPFSTAALIARISRVRSHRRIFIESAHYVGPDRRRPWMTPEYDGPRRRMFDEADTAADTPEVQIRKGLARMYVERISMMLEASGDDRDAMRELCLTCGQLSALASDMGDRLLESAASSLFNYLKGVGAGAPMNRGVVQAHLDAILKLADLPNSQMEIRQTVTHQLSVMVTKKLRQAAQPGQAA